MAQISDDYALEHLEVQTKNDKWFHNRLKNMDRYLLVKKQQLHMEINVQEQIIYYPQRVQVNILVVCLLNLLKH